MAAEREGKGQGVLNSMKWAGNNNTRKHTYTLNACMEEGVGGGLYKSGKLMVAVETEMVE